MQVIWWLWGPRRDDGYVCWIDVPGTWSEYWWGNSHPRLDTTGEECYRYKAEHRKQQNRTSQQSRYLDFESECNSTHLLILFVNARNWLVIAFDFKFISIESWQNIIYKIVNCTSLSLSFPRVPPMIIHHTMQDQYHFSSSQNIGEMNE